MKIKIKQFTKDEITQDALTQLRLRGARVRKVHNVGYYRQRRYQVEKGPADIQGYSQTGVHIECEVKTINDSFSGDQIKRLDDLEACGGIALIAIQTGLTVSLIPWKDAKEMI
jgi:hypothetical protein